VKLGLKFEDDIKRLENIRKAVGPEPILRIDANQGWDRVSALKKCGQNEYFSGPLGARSVGRADRVSTRRRARRGG
jgi:L-alanine-DL-glutamate epimerase-like enolase superfamily enzyme